MAITRRQFLGYAAGAATLALQLPPLDPERPIEIGPQWLLLDLQEHCSLRESLAGYESALAARCIRRETLSLPARCAGWIVPAAVRIPSRACRAIATSLEAGTTVIVESGAGFAAGPDLRAHGVMLRDFLEVRTEAPVQLWTGAGHARSGATPYVDYTWPSPTRVRDFSRVVPLERACAREIIAWVGGVPVGLRRRSGRGTLIFLGSPLGPALWAGDPQARRWLLDVLEFTES